MKTTTLLQNLSDQTALILHEVKSELRDLPQEILNVKPDAYSWSMLECFEHLNRYNQYYLDAIENAITKNRALSGNDEMKTTWIGQKSIAMMHPSNRKKQKTFKRMDPANSTLTAETMNKFIQDQQRLLSLLNQASRSNANARAVSVEFFKMLKMTVAEALEFVIIHEQRHLLQAREVLHANLAQA